MMNTRHPISIYLFCIFIIVQPLFLQVRLPRLVSDGMVLQRDTDINIWGWAGVGEEILIRFLEEEYHAVADDSGRWNIELPASPFQAGE